MKSQYLTKLDELRQKVADGNKSIADSICPQVWYCNEYNSTKSDCCFNHWIGLPEKNGILHPIYQYEKDIIDYLDSRHKHLWILKARGLGITELFLRWIEFICFNDKSTQPSQVILLTGVNMELAKDLIKRIKFHLKDKITETTDAYEIVINNCTVKAYPSNHVHAYRGQENVKIIFGDESAFFTMINDYECRSVVEGYLAKSNPFIVWNSTPNVPEGFHYDIEKEDPSIYRRFFLLYNVGLEVDKQSGTRIYDESELDTARKTPSFNREYCLQWGFGTGDIFEQNAVTEISLHPYDLIPQTGNVITLVDPAYGSSKFAIMVGEERPDGIGYVLFADEYERPSQSEMIARIKSVNDRFVSRTTVIDSSQPGLIAEFPNAQKKVFKDRGLLMTDIAAKRVSERLIRIHPQFKELTRQLLAAKKNEKGLVDKKIISFDLGDCFLMFCDEISTAFYGTSLKTNW